METEMKCPYCPQDDFHYVHIESVRVNCGGEITEITDSGTRMKSGPSAGRGSRVEIIFWCENGAHKWRKIFQFHKGQTLVMDEVIIAGMPDVLFAPYTHELWRD